MVLEAHLPSIAWILCCRHISRSLPSDPPHLHSYLSATTTQTSWQGTIRLLDQQYYQRTHYCSRVPEYLSQTVGSALKVVPAKALWDTKSWPATQGIIATPNPSIGFKTCKNCAFLLDLDGLPVVTGAHLVLWLQLSFPNGQPGLELKPVGLNALFLSSKYHVYCHPDSSFMESCRGSF